MPNEFLKLKVKVSKINYAIEPEDLWECNSDKEYRIERKHILKKLPKKLTFEMDWPKDEIEDKTEIADQICHLVSEITGWLNYGVTYHLDY